MKTLLILAISLFVVACSTDERDTAAVRDSADAREETIGTEIATSLIRPMDKARNVENQVMDQKARMDAALLEAEDL